MSKSKYDNDFKSEVISEGLVKEVVQKKKELYYSNLIDVVNEEDGVIYKASFDNGWTDYVLKSRSNSQLDCAFLLVDSKKRKAKKVKDKISDLLLNNQAYFLTLTFRDEVLQNTTPQTRRTYVRKFLKSVSDKYVANIDFSPDIGREHYHAVILNRIDLKSWSYGFAFNEKVRSHKNDLERVSKYITKLTAHALKVNATRLIYSRL